jgi:glyoxylase-like metal-dependent hydrolase (beta-lactamase superfamily II)
MIIYIAEKNSSNNKVLIIRKILLYISLGIIIISAALAGFYLYKRNASDFTYQINKEIIIINDPLVSTYLIKCDSGYIAIDAGLLASTTAKALSINKILPDEVKFIFITHSDIDHQRSAELFKNATIYISAPEIEMIKNNVPRISFLPFLKNHFNHQRYKTLNDGEDLFIGKKRIKCILLPGHTDGSMGYLVDGKYLFSGDAFRIKKGKLTPPNKKLFVMNLDKMNKSIENVNKIKGTEYILTGNSGFIHLR